MAKIHLDRLKKRYGYTGGPLRELMQDILANQNENISKKIAKRSEDNWKRDLKRVKKDERKLILPDISDVLPKRSVHILKGAENGKLLADDLRDKLTKNLRTSLDTFTPKTGEQNFVIRRGAKAGKINPKLINGLQKDLTKTFTNYTKKDPKIGVPKNIRAIAITEFRSTVNNMKFEYAAKMDEKNPDIIIRKMWIHNASLSKEPRRGHIQQEKRGPVKVDTMFKVPIHGGKKKRRVIGMTLMKAPHDPTAPPEQNINCNCDIMFTTKFRPKKKQEVKKSYFDYNKSDRLKILNGYLGSLKKIADRIKNS